MISDLPAVTIAIPFYNAERTLLDAIRSVFAQTHQAWELILLDDGSTDRSVELARSVRDPRVRVYSDGKNKRLAARLNEVTRLASHSYIARMDADDLMAPERIERLLGILHASDDYDLASCATYSIDADGGLKGWRGWEETDYQFSGLLAKTQRFLHAGLVARKSWYDRNTYDESLQVGQDTELWLRASKRGDFRAVSVAAPLYMYREEGNVTERKLLAAYRMERSRVAPLIDSRFSRYSFTAKSLAKSATVIAMARAGLLGHLLDRRNSAEIDGELMEAFSAACEKIFETKVPGVDHA